MCLGTQGQDVRCKEPIRQSLPPNRLSTQEKTAIRTLAARTPRPSPGVGGRAAMQRLSIGGSWTARWDSWQFGVGILGTQFFESAEKSPLGLDRRQWVRDLEGRMTSTGMEPSSERASIHSI